MMGQCSIFAFCFKVKGLVFLQRTMIYCESNVLPYSKRAFSDVLEGVVLKMLLGNAHRPPFSSRCALTVPTGFSVSSNDMVWHAPIYKTLGAVLFVFP